MSATPASLLSPSTPEFKFPSPAASTPFLRPGDVRDVTNMHVSGMFSPGTPEFPSPPATPMMKPTPLTKLHKKPIIDYSPADNSPPTPTFSSPPKSMHLLASNAAEQSDEVEEPALPSQPPQPAQPAAPPVSRLAAPTIVPPSLITSAPYIIEEGTPEMSPLNSSKSFASFNPSPTTPYVHKSREVTPSQTPILTPSARLPEPSPITKPSALNFDDLGDMTLTIALPGPILDQALANMTFPSHHSNDEEAPASPMAFTMTQPVFRNQSAVKPVVADVENQIQPKSYPKTPLRSASKAKLLTRPPPTPVASIKYSDESALAIEKAKAQLKEIHAMKATFAAKSAELMTMLATSSSSTGSAKSSPIEHFEIDEIPQTDDSDEGVDVNAPLTSDAVRACFVHTFHSDKSAQPAFTAEQIQLMCWRQKPAIEEIHRELTKLEGDGLVVRFELFGQRYWRRK